MIKDDPESTNSDNKYNPQKHKVPFFMSCSGRILFFVLLMIILFISIKLLGLTKGLIVSGIAWLILSLVSMRQMSKIKKVQVKLGDPYAFPGKVLKNSIKDLNSMLDEPKRKQWFKIGIGLGLTLIVTGVVLAIGVIMGPIVASVVILVMLIIRTKIMGVEDSTDKAGKTKPAPFEEFISNWKTISLTVIRDLFILVVTCAITFVFLTPIIFIVRRSLQTHEMGWVVGIKLLATLCYLGIISMIYMFWMSFKSASTTTVSNEYEEAIGTASQKLKYHILPQERFFDRSGVFLLKHPTIFTAALTGMIIAIFAQFSLLGGAGNLSGISSLDALKFVIQAFLDTLLQDFSRIFHIPISPMVPSDIWARLYNWMTRLTLIMLLFTYVINMKVYLQGKSASKRHTETEDKYKEVLKIDSKDSWAHYILGYLLQYLKNYPEAEKKYREAIRINPNDAMVHHDLGSLLHDLKRYPEAEEQYREAIRINPSDAVSHRDLGILLKEMKRYPEAEQEYQESLRINPDDDSTHYNLATLFYDLERYTEAENEYKEAIRINANDAVTHNDLGVLFDRVERYNEAEIEYNEAIKITPNYALAYRNLGLLFIKTGKEGEAKKALEKARDFFKDQSNDKEIKNIEDLLLRLGTK